MNSEEQYIEMEAARIDSSEQYFSARPQIDWADRRRVFEAGFDRGWKAALKSQAKSGPAEDEEIMVNTPYDVYILPLQPSRLSGGPRFVVHVPGPEQPTARPPKPTECMNGCPDRQVCDHCQWPPGPDRQPTPPSTPVEVGYAKRLATSLWQQHYREDTPQWKPCEDLMGLLSQIDNMVSGLTRATQQPAAVDEAMVMRACRHWYIQWDEADRATKRFWAKTMRDLLTAALTTYRKQGDEQ